MKDIKVEYYKMVCDKKLGDNSIIPKNQNLILIKEDNDGMFFFETYIDEYKKLFWANKNEVVFMESIIEKWEDEKINKINKYINGEFL